MATAHIPQRARQMELYPRPPEPFVPHFEEVATGFRMRHLLALAAGSLLVHVALMALVIAAIVAMPKNSPIVLTAKQLFQDDKSVRYMELAPDAQKPPEKPKTDVISDKDRIKSSRAPRLDRKALDELADNLRPGPPGAAGRPGAPPAPPMAAAQPEPQAGGQPGVAPRNQIAGLSGPRIPAGSRLPQFGGSMTAGAAIDQAARAASEQRGGAGAGGDYGLGRALANTPHRDSFEILSDTLGVDFAPYLARMRRQVYTNWMPLIPEAAWPPLRKKGTVVLEFSVLKNGSVAGLRIVSDSGDVSLDRAAYGAITGSNPFPPLPADFGGDFLTIRARFFYNPERHEMR